MKTSSGHRAATMLATHRVKPEQVYATVLTAVTRAMPRLKDGKKYTTAMLCAPTVWSELSQGEGCVAGMCLAYLVRNKMVALRLHRTPSGKGKNHYLTLTTPDTGFIKRVMFVEASAKARSIKLGEKSTPCL
ncbi:MAG: hypothetical protein RL392_956 [Pseudomonadota bacterium]